MRSALLTSSFYPVRTAEAALNLLPLMMVLLLVGSCSRSVPSTFSVESKDGTVERLSMTEMIERSSESSQHFVLGKETKVYFRITHVKFRLKYELSYNWTGPDEAYYQKLLVADNKPLGEVKSAMNASIREVLKESLVRRQRTAPAALAE